MYPINLQKYLDKINISLRSIDELTNEQRQDYLKSIYKAHVMTFPYSNFELRKIARQHIVQRQSLSFFSYTSLLSDEHDSYCFQNALLLADALKQIGYEPEYCAARVLVGASINAPEILALPRTHLALIVTIGNERILLDPGLGSSAPRFPIVINGKDESIIQDCDEFKFHLADNVYVLEKKTSQGWFRIMQTDLEPISQEQVKKNLLQLERHPQTLAIRDMKTVVGVLTDNGRKNLYWDVQSNQLKFSNYEGNESTHQVVTSFKEGVDLLKQEFGIHHISVEALEQYCSATVLPKPIKPWTVEFPIDEHELKKLETNLTF